MKMLAMCVRSSAVTRRRPLDTPTGRLAQALHSNCAVAPTGSSNCSCTRMTSLGKLTKLPSECLVRAAAPVADAKGGRRLTLRLWVVLFELLANPMIAARLTGVTSRERPRASVTLYPHRRPDDCSALVVPRTSDSESTITSIVERLSGGASAIMLIEWLNA